MISSSVHESNLVGNRVLVAHNASFLASSVKKVKAFPTVKEILRKHHKYEVDVEWFDIDLLASFVQSLVDEKKISLAEFESYLIPDNDEGS